MNGIGLVAGIIAAFFAFGIVAGVLAVIALSALDGHRARGGRPRHFGEYDPRQSQPVDWIPAPRPGQPAGPDWAEWAERSAGPSRTQPPGPADSDDALPPWPGRRG